MKKAHLIISQLKNMRALSRLKENDEISKLINSLPLEVRKYIAFAHKKEQILLVLLKNPNLCAEFNTYTAPILLGILKNHQEHFPSLSHIKQIKSYFNAPKHTHFVSKENKITKDEFQNLLKEAKTYHQRRQIIKRFQDQGELHFLPPRHFARYNELIEVYFLQSYEERSNGEFEVHCQNAKLQSIFRSIQQAIKQNLQKDLP